MSYEVVIGLEVHAQLKTQTKLFCGCSTRFGRNTNENVCPVCLGLPGALPVLNKKAVEMAIQAGLALSCDIQLESVFSRKNYFYPDLPKGYQISQFDLPICLGGELAVAVGDVVKKIGVTRIHMEEDAGKLLHQGADAIAGSTHSHVDLNRACTPLIEIVSEPDMRSSKEARAYVETLRQILRHIGVCDGNLEEGSMRVDANISLMPKGSTEYGTRTEVKNINSFRSIERAIESEILRQTDLLDSGGKVVQQTRNYDDATQNTTVLRSKENAHDYRYFPDPDLIPLKITQKMIDRLSESLSELPVDKKKRYKDVFNFTDFECKVLIEELDMMTFFENCIKKAGEAESKEYCKWIIGDLNSLNKDSKMGFLASKVTEDHLISLVGLIKSGKISGKMAKEILEKVSETGKRPEDIVKETGASQITDSSQLSGIIDKILDNNLDVVQKVKSGKTRSADFLMGQVMKETRGQAKPDLVRELILAQINQRP
jgi:aspartyl-tRNA(Asn)/glutamyl-tRNA(Gln) amidotransferase subunit B